MSISLDLFPAGGGSGGLFLRNSVLLILDVVSYHFPSYFNRKNQSLFVNKSLLPTGDQGSLRGDRFFSFYMQLKTTHCRLIARAGPHTHTQCRIENQQIFSEAVECSSIFKFIPKNRYPYFMHTYTPFCIIAIAHSRWTLCEHGRIWQPLKASWNKEPINKIEKKMFGLWSNCPDFLSPDFHSRNASTWR